MGGRTNVEQEPLTLVSFQRIFLHFAWRFFGVIFVKVVLLFEKNFGYTGLVVQNVMFLQQAQAWKFFGNTRKGCVRVDWVSELEFRPGFDFKAIFGDFQAQWHCQRLGTRLPPRPGLDSSEKARAGEELSWERDGELLFLECIIITNS